MKSFKQLLNEVTPQYHTPASLYGGDPDTESIAVHQADRLKKVAGKIAGDKEKAKRVAALGRAISLPLRATDKGEVEYAHSAPDPFGKPGERTAVSSGTPIEKVTMSRDVFGLPSKGMQGAFDSAGTARNLSKVARLHRARRIVSEMFQGTRSECMKMCRKLGHSQEECEKRWCSKSNVSIQEEQKK